MTRRSSVAEIPGARRCPICSNVVPDPTSDASRDASRAHPFCSPRCRAVDLGRWFSETYRIAGESVEREDEDAPLRNGRRLEEDPDA